MKLICLITVFLCALQNNYAQQNNFVFPISDFKVDINLGRRPIIPTYFKPNGVANCNTEVHAISAGTVVSIRNSIVVVRHMLVDESLIESVYTNLNDISVSVDQEVLTGDVVGVTKPCKKGEDVPFFVCLRFAYNKLWGTSAILFSTEVKGTISNPYELIKHGSAPISVESDKYWRSQVKADSLARQLPFIASNRKHTSPIQY